MTTTDFNHRHQRYADPETLQVSLIIPARDGSASLNTTVREAYAFLSKHYPNSFEIILVPNNSVPNNSPLLKDPTQQVAEQLAASIPEVQVIPHLPPLPPGKGAALRTGFLASRGKWIFFTDADLPYDLEFFCRAADHLQSGTDLVTGNRRLAESHFNIPVDLLKLAYRRHCLGLAYNRLVRCFLPIRTTDTQAGIKAFSRRLATQAFERQICPGFLFDLEVFLTAMGFGYRQVELPVTLYLNSEKSTVRIVRECAMVAIWLTRITWKYLRKGYKN